MNEIYKDLLDFVKENCNDKIFSNYKMFLKTVCSSTNDDYNLYVKNWNFIIQKYKKYLSIGINENEQMFLFLNNKNYKMLITILNGEGNYLRKWLDFSLFSTFLDLSEIKLELLHFFCIHNFDSPNFFEAAGIEQTRTLTRINNLSDDLAKQIYDAYLFLKSYNFQLIHYDMVKYVLSNRIEF